MCHRVGSSPPVAVGQPPLLTIGSSTDPGAASGFRRAHARIWIITWLAQLVPGQAQARLQQTRQVAGPN